MSDWEWKKEHTHAHTQNPGINRFAMIFNASSKLWLLPLPTGRESLQISVTLAECLVSVLLSGANQNRLGRPYRGFWGSILRCRVFDSSTIPAPSTKSCPSNGQDSRLVWDLEQERTLECSTAESLRAGVGNSLSQGIPSFPGSLSGRPLTAGL